MEDRIWMLRRRTPLNRDLGPLRRELNTTISGKVPPGGVPTQNRLGKGRAWVVRRRATSGTAVGGPRKWPRNGAEAANCCRSQTMAREQMETLRPLDQGIPGTGPLK